jgi:dienelactone hydrolase
VFRHVLGFCLGGLPAWNCATAASASAIIDIPPTFTDGSCLVTTARGQNILAQQFTLAGGATLPSASFSAHDRIADVLYGSEVDFLNLPRGRNGRIARNSMFAHRSP